MDFKTLFASVPAAADLFPEGSEVQSITMQKEAGALQLALALPRLVTGKDIAKAVQGILDARRETGKPLVETCKKMPENLRKAHKRLDEIIDEAYGLSARYGDRLAALLKRAMKPACTVEEFF